MGDLGARAGGNQRRKPGVAEEVEHLHRPPRLLDQAGHVVPMRSLLGKDADMAERGEAAEIVNAVMPHRPGFAERCFWKTPAAHAFLVGVAGEHGVGAVPFAFGQRTPPDCLPFRADDAIGSVLLQLLAVAAVEQRIVGIGRDFEDERQLFGRQRAGPASFGARRLGSRRIVCDVARVLDLRRGAG